MNHLNARLENRNAYKHSLTPQRRSGKVDFVKSAAFTPDRGEENCLVVPRWLVEAVQAQSLCLYWSSSKTPAQSLCQGGGKA